VAFWINPKGALVAVVCGLWDPSGIGWMAAGFAAVSGAVFAWLGASGALAGWWEEVWIWGRLYAASTFVESPLWNGAVRTLGWMACHAAAVAVGAGAGLRFFPRYYFLLLPGMVLMAARGFTLPPRRRALLAASLLLIPLVRFGPSYATALGGGEWRDTAMDRDSRRAAALIRQRAKPGDTLLAWGYRPELYVYTGLPAATRYLDSQPLTGVPADRHLTDSRPVETGRAAGRRATLAQSSPAFVADGLGPYNPQLAITNYAELRQWLAGYREVARTGGTVIYQRRTTEPAKGRAGGR
jgi:hypothetical protein